LVGEGTKKRGMGTGSEDLRGTNFFAQLLIMAIGETSVEERGGRGRRVFVDDQGNG
jgi:hypothetical protein